MGLIKNKKKVVVCQNQGINLGKRRVIYPLWAKNALGVLAGITSEESWMIVSTMMASSWEDFPPRGIGLLIHDPEAAMAQSTVKPRGLGAGDKDDTSNSLPVRLNLSSRQHIAMGDRPEHTVVDKEVPEPDP